MKVCNTCYVEKANNKFAVNNRFADNLQKICKDCESARRKKTYNPERARQAWKRNKYSTPEMAEYRRLMATYGISKQFRDYMIASVNELCEICHKKTKLVVDHDHVTGLVRGMLCSKCNRGLGHFDDDTVLLSSALLYLYDKQEKNATDFN